MMRVVLDANVFVSAALKPNSNPGKIIDLVNRHSALPRHPGRNKADFSLPKEEVEFE